MKNKQKDLIIAYKELFDTPQGKVVLKDLLGIGRINQPSYVMQDPHATAFNEGSRRVVLYILEKLNADPEAIARLMKYNYDEDL